MFCGHTGEVVAVQFDPQKQLVATASMDTTARLFNCETGNHSYEYSVYSYQVHYTFARSFHDVDYKNAA